MTTTLKLQIETTNGIGTKPRPFPGSGDEQACLSDYKYSATRMSSAPNITAKLKWHRCLDKEWSTKVFVSYNGERYFIKNTPSSSYDNTSIMYSHSLELVSERAILDSVYFVDASTKKNNAYSDPQGDSLSDNPVFSFSGNIHEFVDRLNKSLAKSGVGGPLGYKAVVDDNVNSETKLFEISNQYVTDVLKSAYELYEVPYYFVGKTIHFGNQQYDISTPLEYGIDKSLLSISKSNSNKQAVTRITGTGSKRNIPYYYPNPTPKGFVGAKVTSGSFAVTIFDEIKFANEITLDRPLRLSYPTENEITVSGYRGLDAFGSTSSEFNTYNNQKGAYGIYTNYQLKTGLLRVVYSGKLTITLSINSGEEFVDKEAYSIIYEEDDGTNQYLTNTYIESTILGKIHPNTINGLTATFDNVPRGEYTLYIRIGKTKWGTSSVKDSLREISWFPTISTSGIWVNSATNREINLKDIGVLIVGGLIPKIGAEITPFCKHRINVSNTLLPSEYRRTSGSNRWYNATNSADRGEWYGDIEFSNEFDSAHPSEYILAIEDIFPTIKGITNAAGNRIDSFLEIAFDEFDNNEIYGEDHEKAGEYVHPYFFAKLKKTDGPNGFNLFDHAIEDEEMKISFTTGHVASCEFTIGVDEESQKNLVQIYTEDTIVDGFLHEKGTLKTNKDGDILCGRWGQEKPSPQEIQQDTENNEVWIALRKDDSTMGVLMPDATNNLVPLGDLNAAGDLREGGGDLFVILGINLPESYITAAEDKLEKKILEYLRDNNSERFSFSLKFSSIFLAKNPDFAEKINENSRVNISYDGETYPMYVSSYSLTANGTSALPEITITVDDEIKVVKKKIKDITSIVADTRDKIRDIKTATETFKAQILSTNSTTKNNSEQIKLLQEMLSRVDLASLTSQVVQNTVNINTLDQRVRVAFFNGEDEPSEEPMMTFAAPRYTDDIDDDYDEGDVVVLAVDDDNIEDAIIIEETSVGNDVVVVEEAGEPIIIIDESTDVVVVEESVEDPIIIEDLNETIVVLDTTNNDNIIITN